jgi:hypothetical protein
MQKQQQLLEAEVETRAATVADWKRSVASIETQFNTANAALVRAKKQRETHALKASMGDGAATAAIKAARAEQLAAEQTSDDLKIALPEMEAQLAAAEKAAASARHQLAKFEAEVLMKQRIEVAGQMDGVIAEYARLYALHEKLGAQIVNMDVLPRDMHGGISNQEGAVGARRVRASLPRFFWKLFPGAVYDEMPTENLATSEARFWNLAPESPEKAKAA